MILKTILHSPAKHDLVLRTALFWAITQRIAVISYRSLEDDLSVPSSGGQDSLRNNLEERSCHLPRGERLKPHDQVLCKVLLHVSV